MAHKGWKNFADSKFWSWFTLGANKAATAVHAMTSKDFRKYLDRVQFEKRVNDLGYTLDEWFQAYPEDKAKYDSLDGSINSRIDDSDPDSSWVKNSLKGLVDNLTGQRDVVENEKNRQFQSDEADEARVWQEEQARQEREWNSIGAQMERAAAVGINPISIAMSNGGINASTPTSIPGTPAVPMGNSGVIHSGALDIASTIFNGIGTFAEQRLKETQADDIVAMRQYNIAEKIATTDHLRQLCEGVGLSNVAQQIQNSWLDRLNQATYESSLGSAAKSRTSARLDLQQIESIKQDMSLNLQRFNATLPLELQLMESELDLKNASVQQIYTEISMRHLQAIEQESRNLQAASEAESSALAAGVAKATYEDAISAFHNDMVRGAAEAGISLYDYQYYGTSFSSAAGGISKALGKLKFGDATPSKQWRDSRNIKGLGQ